MLLAPIFTSTVLYFNWRGIMVQSEILLFMGVGFFSQLFSLAWVTVTKERCKCATQDIPYEGEYVENDRLDC